MWSIAGHSFQPRKLKLGVNDHLIGADVLGYPDIRISAFEIFGFLRILGPCDLNFKAIMLKLGVNNHLMGADVPGYSDIRISAFEIVGFFALISVFSKGKANAVGHVYQIPLRAQRATYTDRSVKNGRILGANSATCI